MKPSIGRVVHYVAYGTPGGEFEAGAHRAAIVTEVRAHTTEGRIALCVLNPAGQYFNLSVAEDQTAKTPGTWHWPEREE